jgi:hypothetical protein
MRSTAFAIATAAILGLSACGSSGSDAADTTAATAATTAETTAPADTTTAATTTVAAVDTTAAAAADTTAATSAAGAAVDVSLVEWAVNATGTPAAGTVTLNVTNDGQFPHELLVIKGDSYESLPLDANGAVEEAQLTAGALIGETERLDGGATTTLTAELTAGHYVLLCNIVGGGSSHAARGQVLELDVA